MIATPDNPLSSRVLLERAPIPPAAAPLLAPLLTKALQLNRLDRFCNEMDALRQDPSFFHALLDRLGTSIECEAADLSRVPSKGPAVIVCNHPFGLIEGPILGSLLERIRPDFKFLANALLASVPNLENYVIPVDPFGGERAVRANWKPLRESIQWVRNGGLLVVFPAGEVSSLHLQHRQIADPAWNEAVVRIIQAGRAAAVPLFFHGMNSAAFQIAGLIHPALRTILLPREFFNKKGQTIRLSVGRPIPYARLASFGSREALDYLRSRTQLLQQRVPAVRQTSHSPKPQAIAAPEDPQKLRAEVDALPASQRLLASANLHVVLARARQIPLLLREIGRQREICFRGVGEGTGKALDLDRFDNHYQHLVLWNSERNEVAGSYRIAATDEILPRFGSKGLYTSTLFRFRPGFLERLGPALELGRSFVRVEYQKDYQPLLLLWKGIGRLIAQRPRYRFLFGPVSISNEYGPASRALIASFLATHHRSEGLAGGVTPLRPFQPARGRLSDVRQLSTMLADIDELAQVVSDLEPDHKGLPVLLRQYLNLGGNVVDFNVDHKFSDVLDGLVVVDLLKLTPRMLERYLGASGARDLQAWHGIPTAGLGQAGIGTQLA